MKQGSVTNVKPVGLPPRVAAEIYGERLPLAQRYAHLLATTGIEHGLLGPREADKMWDRHIVNCAIMESLLPHRTRVVDIGSGAGLPGVALAIARPDLRVSLVEPLARRITWLEQTVEDLGLPHVSVHHARAEAMVGLIQAQVVVARAVARLDQLVAWAWPLLPQGGRLLALKGHSAEAELEQTLPRIEGLGMAHAVVHVLGSDLLAQPVRVVEIVRATQPRYETVPGKLARKRPSR
ncbi:MAG: 16S rRNA (guanine(527)-N(7))-methyltransferase RsmG [Ornithinimicrobium sp.]